MYAVENLQKQWCIGGKHTRSDIVMNQEIQFELPEKVNEILNTLMEQGYEAYAVGGCVRDALLGKEPKDWDITTSAKPIEVKKLFRRTIDTGLQHGTVTIMMGKEGFEVTTYRVDGEYEDGRHPKEVTFTASLEEDLKRRDFTMNAMAYNKKEGLIDLFDGRSDLQKKMIRCVGDPVQRFEEDALRMLRAVRFAGQLGFTIDSATKEAIRQKAETLDKISAERICAELNQLLCSRHSEQLVTAYELGITKVVFPEFDEMMTTGQDSPHHYYTVGEHAMKVLEYMNQAADERQLDEKIYSVLCWTAILHDVAKGKCKTLDENGVGHFWGHQEEGAKMARRILTRFRFDNYTIDMVNRLVKWHDYRFHLTKKSVRRAINRIGEDLIPLLFLMERADVYGQSEYQKEEKLQLIEEAEHIYQEIVDAKECVTLKSLAVNGKDLMEIGVQPGKKIGEILKMLLEEVLDDPSKNQKEILLAMVKAND